MPDLPSNFLSRLLVRLFFAAALAISARASERYAWPFFVAQADPANGPAASTQFLGPLVASQTMPDGSTRQLLRPLWWQTEAKDGSVRVTHLLYPFFTWQHDATSSSFSFFQLINHRRTAIETNRPTGAFDIWPLYFSRDTGDPATSYHALLPFGGTIKNRFGKDELTFALWPLYVHSVKNGQSITSTPCPFIRTITGAGHHGFEFWPLFGSRARPDDYRRQFALWPLLYRHEKNLTAAEPDVKLGILPFYARETGPGLRSETYAWPFFGYTHRTAPDKYDETRYFWPFLVQGRGDTRRVNRFAPLYSHSVIKGHEKTWLLWPLFRQDRWQADGVAQQKDAFLFFLYHSLEQRSLTNPAAAPAAKRHLWPFLSTWDNGAGRRQTQFLSPFEVFFPHNEPIRQLYTPLFALYRFDQRAPGDTRHTLLWNFLGWKNSPTEKQFHVGPFGWQRDSGATRSRFFFFSPRSLNTNQATPPAQP